MIRRRYAVILVSACALLLSIGKLRLLAQTIKFEVPAVVDPIHTNGEPDIAIDPSGRIFVSGPTGTGTQRSTWFGSVDRATRSGSLRPDRHRPRLRASLILQVAETLTSLSIGAGSS